MKRLALLVAMTSGPAAAWEFSPTPICTLIQPTEKGSVTVTYDPVTSDYAIALTLTGGDTWPAAGSFAISFLGPRPLNISTDRHVVSEDKTTLMVTDTGFGNVLDGLQFNAAAAAQSGDMQMIISLSGAAEPVAAFRNCGSLHLS